MTDSIINATAYAGQAVLINWSETDKGRMVTFLLAEEDPVHPFKGYKRGPEHGQRFELACVCVADDDSMQSTDEAKASKKARKSTNGPDSGPPPHGQPTKTPPNGQDKARSLSQVAYLYCGRHDFQSWLGVSSDEDAAQRLYSLCQITSRKELDTNEAAAREFRDVVARFHEQWKK
jgi:hypothetical protein